MHPDYGLHRLSRRVSVLFTRGKSTYSEEGAGKTSVILSLLPKLPKDYKVVLLKVGSRLQPKIATTQFLEQNEFGDVAVDSELAKQSSLAAVSEILNGCM
jgi:hypothetical protein